LNCIGVFKTWAESPTGVLNPNYLLKQLFDIFISQSWCFFIPFSHWLHFSLIFSLYVAGEDAVGNYFISVLYFTYLLIPSVTVLFQIMLTW